MDVHVPPWLLITLITSACLLAGYVLGALRRVSRSTHSPKSEPSPAVIPTSLQAQLDQQAADQAALSSTLQSLTTTMKRLSSRHGMQDLRARGSSEAPPVGTSKADLLRHYGMSGKIGPAFYQAQLELERPNGKAN